MSGRGAERGRRAVRSGVRRRRPLSHDLRIVGNYHGNELGMYDQLIGNANRRRIRTQIVVATVLATRERWLSSTPASTNPTAALTRQRPASSARRSSELAGPVRNAAGSMVYAYQIPLDNPTGVGRDGHGEGTGRCRHSRPWSIRASIRRASRSSIRRRPQIQVAPIADASGSSDDPRVGHVDDSRRVRHLTRSTGDRRSGTRRFRELLSGMVRDRGRKARRGRTNELQPDRRRAAGWRALGSTALHGCRVREGQGRDACCPWRSHSSYWESDSLSISDDRSQLHAARDDAVTS